MERLEALLILCDLFFTRSSLLVQNIELFVAKCRQKKLLLKTSNHLDESFIPKLLYSIDDTRIKKWLNECMQAKTLMDTSIELISFTSILTDIQLNRFVCFLPSNIKKISSPVPESNDDVKPIVKKAKTDNQVKNNDMVSEWKLGRKENWNHVFQNKIKEGPKLSCGTYPCLKWHVKGVCYTDCAFRKSHSNLSGSDASKTTEFIKKLREQA